MIALAVLLGGLSLYLNKDWFAKDHIQIYHRSRPEHGRIGRRSAAQQQDSTINPIVFGFDRKCKLTDLKIVPLSDIETNKYPQPIWHLVSESNLVPIKDFMYGSRIGGMHPAIKDAKPEPLEPGVTYRLFVQTTTEKVQHDFVPDPRVQ